MTVDNVNEVGSLLVIGEQALGSLRAFGTAIFYVDEQRKIRLGNPLKVFLMDELAHAPEGVEPEYVQPILTARRPQYIGQKPDGSWWVVEYPSPELDGE